MLTNQQMRPYRYENWAKYRRIHRTIVDALNAGKRVTIGTYLRATTYDRRHLSMFTVDRRGCYVARGKRRDDITGCAIIVTD